MSESKFKFLETFNLIKLAEISNVPYHKLYYRKTGKTQENLTPEDSTKVANGLKKSLDPLFEKLGFAIKINRVSSPRP